MVAAQRQKSKPVEQNGEPRNKSLTVRSDDPQQMCQDPSVGKHRIHHMELGKLMSKDRRVVLGADSSAGKGTCQQA